MTSGSNALTFEVRDTGTQSADPCWSSWTGPVGGAEDAVSVRCAAPPPHHRLPPIKRRWHQTLGRIGVCLVGPVLATQDRFVVASAVVHPEVTTASSRTANATTARRRKPIVRTPGRMSSRLVPRNGKGARPSQNATSASTRSAAATGEPAAITKSSSSSSWASASRRKTTRRWTELTPYAGPPGEPARRRPR